jgi:glyceraldehyde-3-phosphate dehydrogenase (ferredoxin)
MDCLDAGELQPADLGVETEPRWDYGTFDLVGDSLHNARLGLELIGSILARDRGIDLLEGPRKWGRSIRRSRGTRILDRFVYTANGRRGWMVPNQYWTPGALAPMAIMGKYYMHYGPEFLPPRELGRACAARLKAELVLDEAGICRFHRAWAEEMVPEIYGALYSQKEQFLASTAVLASRINSRNASVFWESERDIRFIATYLERRLTVDKDPHPELPGWVQAFATDPAEAALSWWFEVRKGIDESLREFL